MQLPPGSRCPASGLHLAAAAPSPLGHHVSLQLILIQTGSKVRGGNLSLAWAPPPPAGCITLHVNARGMGHPERSCWVTDMRRHSALFTNLCRLQGQWALPAASLPQSPGPGPNASADARCCLEVPLCLSPPKGFSPQGACGPPPSCQQCLLGLRSRERYKRKLRAIPFSRGKAGCRLSPQGPLGRS